MDVGERILSGRFIALGCVLDGRRDVERPIAASVEVVVFRLLLILCHNGGGGSERSPFNRACVFFIYLSLPLPVRLSVSFLAAASPLRGPGGLEVCCARMLAGVSTSQSTVHAWSL